MPPKHKPRARMSGPERREQLLDAVKAIADSDGFHAISIEAVARAAGITRPVVYAHFEDLDDLLEAMVEREGRRALSQLAEILPTYPVAGNPGEALTTALRGYLEAVRADPATWRLVLMPPEGTPAVLREQVAQGRDAVVAVLAQFAGQGFGAGLPSPDPELTGRMISTLADESARLMLTDPERYPIDRLVEHSRWVLNQISVPGLPATSGGG
jgi:AcrR family transcriptional regulator